MKERTLALIEKLDNFTKFANKKGEKYLDVNMPGDFNFFGIKYPHTYKNSILKLHHILINDVHDSLNAYQFRAYYSKY